MKDESTPAVSRNVWGASSWVLAIAATAGVGVGVGASVAAGRASSTGRAVPATTQPIPAQRTAAVAATPSPSPSPSPTPTSTPATTPALAPTLTPTPTPTLTPTPTPTPALTPTPSGPMDMAAVDRALDEQFKKQKSNRQFAKEFYAAYGAGRFASAAGPTVLGTAIIARAQSLADDAIDPTPYAVDELTAAAQDTAADGGVQLEARLFQTLLDLVMDHRFLHKAGPFRLYDRADIYEREKKELTDFVAQMIAAPDVNTAMALLDPPHPQYQTMKAALAEYRKLAAAEPGCPKLSAGWRFRAGSRGEEVKKLQQRLACEGYYTGEINGHFEGATVDAVKAYQAHHDLPPEGNVLEDTMESLLVPLDRRVKQIELAMQRMRESRFDRMGDFFLRVNIPAFTLRAYEKGQVIREHRVIVGTNKLDDDKVQLVQGHINRTKLFGTRLYEVIVNPTWILPKRVEEGELATSLEKDADYLTKTNIKKVKLGSGTEVLVQGAGKGNVLGKVKFLLEETNAIYLHDTDKRQLFKKQRRDFSHGCMRIDQAIDFGKWLLARDGFGQDEIDKAFAASSLQRGFDLKNPVYLVTEYITVDLASDGKPLFYDDIYGYDSAYWNDKLPPGERTRWGSEILRPRWVPVMAEDTVDGWRKAGKAAPRNLGPDGKPKPIAPKDPDIDEGP